MYTIYTKQVKVLLATTVVLMSVGCTRSVETLRVYNQTSSPVTLNWADDGGNRSWTIEVPPLSLVEEECPFARIQLGAGYPWLSTRTKVTVWDGTTTTTQVFEFSPEHEDKLEYLDHSGSVNLVIDSAGVFLHFAGLRPYSVKTNSSGAGKWYSK